MPYSCTVSLLAIEGGALPTINGTLWLLWVRLGSGNQQEARESVVVSLASLRTLSFSAGPDNNDLSRDIALSIQEQPGIADSTGWLFRSGRFQTLPVPTANVDIVICPPTRFSGAEILSENVSARNLPLVLDGTTITSMITTNVSGGFILTVGGTSPAPFTHSLTVTLRPSADQHTPQTIFDWDADNTGSDSGVVTTAARNFTNARVAEIINDLTIIVERGAIQSLAAVTVPRPAPGTRSGPLAPEVSCSVRRVVATGSGMAIFPTLGAFGNVAALQFPEREPQQAPGPGGICGGSSLVAYLALPVDLDQFRRYRDTVLRRTPLGRDLIEFYYLIGHEVFRLLATDPASLSAAGGLMVQLEQEITRSGRPSTATLRAAVRLVLPILRRSSPDLADLVGRRWRKYLLASGV